MPMQATSTFEIRSWDEHELAEIAEAPKLTRASVVEGYHGDLEGEGNVEYLMVYADENGAATVVSMTRVVGRLGERSGGFALQGSGSYADGTAKSELQIVPGSGSGELRGLRGSGNMVAHQNGSATISLDYDFG